MPDHGSADEERSWRAHVLEVFARQPGSELTHPFGDDTAVPKVAGKMFALLTLEGAPVRLTLKAEPAQAAALVRDHPWAAPGYHMDKRHWITLTLGSDVPRQQVEELVEDSYDLVVDGLPRHARPPGAHGWVAPPAAVSPEAP